MSSIRSAVFGCALALAGATQCYAQIDMMAPEGRGALYNKNAAPPPPTSPDVTTRGGACFRDGVIVPCESVGEPTFNYGPGTGAYRCSPGSAFYDPGTRTYMGANGGNFVCP